MTGAHTDPDSGIVTRATRFGSVEAGVSALIDLVEARGMTVFARIDHSAEAGRYGLELRDTTVVIFGSPLGGTPAMEASPLTALDLPLKLLVWDDGGHVRISYTDPAVLAARHHLDGDLAAPLSGITGLADQLAG